MAHLRKGETYADLATGFAIGTTTVFRYIREALDVLAALAPTLRDAVTVAARKAFVIIDGTLLRIDRVGMTSGRDRPYYSGKHKCHGVNVQVIADPAGRLIWASPALPGARHDMGAAREHGILDALHRRRDTGDSRQRLPRLRVRGSAATTTPRPSQADTSAAVTQPTRGQHRTRPPTGSGRTGQRPAQDLENPPQDPLLPTPDHRTPQGHPGPHPRRLTPSGKGSVHDEERSPP
jgi:hypothetical protein